MTGPDRPYVFNREHDIAAQVALMELMRIVIELVCDTPDPEKFKRRLQAIESAAVERLGDGKRWAHLDEPTETRIKEAAIGWVSRILTSIRHEGVTPGKDPGPDIT